MAATTLDLPALGKPTRATSATSLSSSTTSRCSPGSPSSAKPGALRRGEARAALPRPPRPPRAMTKEAPAPTRSASTSPPGVRTMVPLGTRRTMSAAFAPCRWSPAPGLPFAALRCGPRWNSRSVVTLGSTTATTSPPLPPLPPSGPPSGLNFSRMTEATAVATVARLRMQRDLVDEGDHGRHPSLQLPLSGGLCALRHGAARAQPATQRRRRARRPASSMTVSPVLTTRPPRC